MASNEFLRFLETLLGDEELRGRFASLDASGVRESIAAIVELGAAAGFHFDRHDVANVIDRANEPKGPLLNTGELDIVAGGRSGETGVPVAVVPPDGGRTVLVDTSTYRKLLTDIREAIEQDGRSSKVLESVWAETK